MADSKKPVELVSADGKRSWSSSDPVEVTNLRSRGWRNKPVPETPAPKSSK